MTFYSNVKQKSYVLNPRGKPLYDDSNRFGTKMLEKMGWSKGKGLGANEDGEQNFIRVSHKTDQKGIGFQDRDDQWTGHESLFNSLLKSLDNSANPSENEQEDNDPTDCECTGFGFGFTSDDKKVKNPSKSIKSKLSGKSLEEMSQKSGVRVHYRKFTRGKDTSKYSEKDLANIFGKKCVNGDVVEKVEETIIQEEDVTENNYGITTIDTGTTIQDYFNKKKHSKENIDESTTTEPLVELSEKKRKKSDKKCKRHADVSNEIIAIDAEQSLPAKKAKKSKKSKKETTVNEMIVISEENSDCEIVAIKMKKKKKKSKKDMEKKQETTAIQPAICVDDKLDETEEKPQKKRKRDKKRNNEETSSTNPEVKPIESVPITNTQFIDGILSILVNPSSTALSQSNADNDDAHNLSSTKTTTNIAMDEVFEINRYHAEMFRFVDLDGFPNANLSDLSGYGFGKNLELKISEKSKDQIKINDLWDNALINKYGKEVIQAKKTKRYSMKHLKKKNLFMKL